ncbi:MAG: DNA-processing protein DprA [Candidatus Beckwithbacteria bacterium]
MSNKEEVKYRVGLSGFKGLGYKRLQLLLKYFKSVKDIWEADRKTWEKLGINAQMAEDWDRWRKNRNLDQELIRLSRQEVRVLTIEDKNYPKILKEIDSPPFLLFIKGSAECLNQPSLTVVGSRRMTGYGQRATTKLVGELSKNLVIISGLARGIDGWAHRVCLKACGKTVAVLGHGLDRIYPREHQALADEIVRSNSCLVSEFPFDYPIEKINFPQRDRILAGLSLGTLVIEGGQRSGTKITAGFAADYGREVFCVPGPIDSEVSTGTAELIQQGAKLVTKPEDVLDELKLPES